MKRLRFPLIVISLLLVTSQLTLAQRLSRKSNAGTPAQRTARYFESIRQQPPQLLAFLLRMPKGGDLHNHLSGAIYAETYIDWAAQNGLCVDQTAYALSQPPCAPDTSRPPVNDAKKNGLLYRQMIDAWSMRNWQFAGQSGHDHFFDAFPKFSPATYGQTGQMLAEAVKRAARGHVLYLELMLTPDSGMATQLGQDVKWDDNYEGTLNKLQTAGIAKAATQAKENLRQAEILKDSQLQCGRPQADPGCAVTVRYVFQVGRGAALGPVYAQMLAGFMLANEANPKVVALNLVQPEDGFAAMQNFPVHMRMLDFLHGRYPQAHITLHAGELAPGLVPPDGLSFHIRDSVNIGHAGRIGHGVDIMHETDADELLRAMARRNILVEICLSSNDLILGVRGREHPLKTYMQYGVPLALATDDEGVARSEISREFLRAADEQGLNYTELKTLARNSLQHAFIGGASLWRDARKFTAVLQCAGDTSGPSPQTSSCRQFIASSEKARLQWELERAFSAFENRY